uniref:Metalloendopeptidase n=1 Tax=Haemonchus contortus TaxID=6289 RepID=A0A7I4YEU2_HAECO
MFRHILLLVLFPATTAVGTVPVPNESAKLVKDRFDDLSEKFLLPEDFIYADEKPVDIPTDAILDAVQNAQLFEGDIIGMPSSEVPALRRLRDDPFDDDEVRIFGTPYHSALNLATYPEKLWADAQVPYMLEEGMTNDQRAAIAQAFDEYKKKTCVRFVPRNDDDFDYIYIKRNTAFGCSSYVGRAGGNQTVSLEVDKCFSKGIIAHELMHALGFFHEHSRTDRDQYVDIQEDNIRPGMLRNFEKYPRKIIDPLGMPYDYDSVMHYHKLAFSRNGKATIVPKKRSVEVGQRYKLSEIDAKKVGGAAPKTTDRSIIIDDIKVNKLYECGEYSATSTTTTTAATTTTRTTTTRRPTTSTRSRTRPGRTRSTSRRTTATTTRRTRTTTTTAAPTTVSRRIHRKCEDLNAHCSMWEQLGHCQHSTKYMAHYCRKACRMCEDDFTTTTEKPRGINKERGRGGIEERGGKREKEKEKEKPSEEKEKCVDKNLFCGYWAKIGECKSESKFMKIFCKASCGRC